MAKLAGARSLLAPSLANISSAVPHYQGRAPPVLLLLLLLQVHQVPPLQDPREECQGTVSPSYCPLAYPTYAQHKKHRMCEAHSNITLF